MDGATWDLIRPWAEKGKLPTFKKLMENGVWGELESTIPPWSIPAWNSLTTGKNPGKLGFATFMVKDNHRFKPYFMSSFVERNIWDILSENGKKVIVANPPNIHSAYKINGCMVAGWLYKDKETLTYPRNLRYKLDKITGGYKVDIMIADVNKGKIVKSVMTDKEYLKSVNEMILKHSKSFTYLLENNEWDFAFMVFADPDRTQHRFWDYKKILLEQHMRLDAAIGDLLQRIDDETNIMLVSDHGFGPRKKIFNINEWLLKEGYLELRRKKKNKLSKIIELLIKTKTFSITRFLLNFLPSKLLEFLTDKVQVSAFEPTFDIEWHKTKAFCYSVCGDIYLNVYDDRVRDDIIQKLKTLRYLKNSREIKEIPVKVFKKEEIYRGEHLDKLPDLVILVDENIQAVNPGLSNGRIFTEGWGGEHRINGIFLAYGPLFRKGGRVNNAKIYDIAPTILHIFGIPIPKDMDGTVLKEIFEEGSELAKGEILYQEISEKERIRRKVRKLRTLGI